MSCLHFTLLALLAMFSLYSYRLVSDAVDPNECFPVAPMPDLTTYTFFHNFWNEINRTNTDLDDGTNCGRFKYTHAPAMPGDPELVVFDHRYNESDAGHDFVIFGNATTNGNLTKVEIEFPKDSALSSYYVLGTDYDWYAVVYSCDVESVASIKERMWVLSRREFSKENQTEVAEKMKNVLTVVEAQGSEFSDRAYSKLLHPCPLPNN